MSGVEVAAPAIAAAAAETAPAWAGVAAPALMPAFSSSFAPVLAGASQAASSAPWFSSLFSGINPLSAAFSGASTLMQGLSQKGMADRQDKLSQAMTAYKLSKSQQGQEAITKFVDTIKPGYSDEERANEVRNLADSLGSSIAATRKYETSGAIGGNTGEDYSARLTSNNATLAERLKRAIAQLSVIGAPAQQDINISRRYGRAASDVSAANTAADNVGGSYMNAISNQRPDPYLSLGSQLASGLGMASALKRSTVI